MYLRTLFPRVLLNVLSRSWLSTLSKTLEEVIEMLLFRFTLDNHSSRSNLLHCFTFSGNTNSGSCCLLSVYNTSNGSSLCRCLTGSWCRLCLCRYRLLVLLFLPISCSRWGKFQSMQSRIIVLWKVHLQADGFNSLVDLPSF